MMITLDTAIFLASTWHEDQVDKSGRPYILHPLRVMLRLEGDDDAMIVAVLHDVFEDTEFTFEELAAYEVPDHIFDALKAITRPKKDTPNRPTYKEYVRALADNPLARRVKIADLLDNMSPARWKDVPKSFHGILDRYEWAMDLLMKKEFPDNVEDSESFREMGEHPPLRVVPDQEEAE